MEALVDMDEPNRSTHRDFPDIEFRTRLNRRGERWIAEAWVGENVVASTNAGTEAGALSGLRSHLMESPHYVRMFPGTAPGQAPHVAA